MEYILVLILVVVAMIFLLKVVLPSCGFQGG